MSVYTAGHLVDVSEVRTELNDLLDTFRRWKNEHAAHPGHSFSGCQQCARYDHMMSGVLQALRRFGARPRL